MQNKRILTVVLAVIVVLVGVAVAFNLAARSPAGQATGLPSTGAPAPSATPNAAPPAAPAASSQGATASNEATAPVRSDGKEPVPTQGGETSEPALSTASKSSSVSAGATSTSSAPVPSASASAVEKPKLEVPVAVEPSKKTLPKSVERTPALSGNVPPEGTAKGKLIKGFPTKALPIPEGSHIVDSSVSTQNRNVQASANLRTNMSQEKVLAFYESQAAKKGWLATRGNNVDGTATVTISYGNDTVVATVRTAGTGATAVAVFGSFKVGK